MLFEELGIDFLDIGILRNPVHLVVDGLYNKEEMRVNVTATRAKTEGNIILGKLNSLGTPIPYKI